MTGRVAFDGMSRVDQIDARFDPPTKGAAAVVDARVQDRDGDTLTRVASIPCAGRADRLLEHNRRWAGRRIVGC